MEQAVAVTGVSAVVRGARAVVFDFDGTLVDSNPIKWRAFERCFAEFPERRAEILAYCRGYHHTPRDEKFRHVYEEILGLPYSPAVAARLHRWFDEETTCQVIAAQEIPGATPFLLGARRARVTALLSSTPHETLLHILAERRWLELFESVRGAPVNKADWLRAFREERGLEEQEVIFFGDTPEDADAAAVTGCTFVGVANDALGIMPVHQIRDFTELLPV